VLGEVVDPAGEQRHHASREPVSPSAVAWSARICFWSRCERRGYVPPGTQVRCAVVSRWHTNSAETGSRNRTIDHAPSPLAISREPHDRRRLTRRACPTTRTAPPAPAESNFSVSRRLGEVHRGMLAV
jgi:hypothetical protein